MWQGTECLQNYLSFLGSAVSEQLELISPKPTASSLWQVEEEFTDAENSQCAGKQVLNTAQ